MFYSNGIFIENNIDLKFSIDPYTYKVTVSGNEDKETLSLMEQILNEGNNGKNLWKHVWICMHNSSNEIVNSQANSIKANQYSLWHEIYNATGYDVRNVNYEKGIFVTEDGKDLLELFKKNGNSAGYELFSNRLLEYTKNGWNVKNDLVLEIGFNADGLYDIGQENGFGINQCSWIDRNSIGIFDVKI